MTGPVESLDVVAPKPPVAERTRGAIWFELLATFGLFTIPLILASFQQFRANDWSRPAGTTMIFVVQELLFIALFFYVLRANGQRLSDLSRPPDRRDVGRTLLLALGVSVAYAAASIGLWLTTSLVEPTREVEMQKFFGHASPIPFLALLLVNPFCEELWLRAFLQTRLEELRWPAAAIVTTSAGIQAAYHLYQGVGRALAYVVVFAMFAAYFQRTRRLAPVVGVHLLTDLGSGIFLLLTWGS